MHVLKSYRHISDRVIKCKPRTTLFEGTALKHLRVNVGPLVFLFACFFYLSERSRCNNASDFHLPRLFLVYDESKFYFFEDWVKPFLYALGMSLQTIKLSIEPEMQNFTTTLQNTLRPGDTVLLLQSTFGIQKAKGVEYWFLNTEGPDKNFVDVALMQGFKKVIDYSSFNAERHVLAGAQESLWLPIEGSHSITFHNFRDKLCMVGGANTDRRIKFAEDFHQLARQRRLKVSIFEIRGWGHQRDYSSQTCALVVNVASVYNNHATPRLRLDKLWQFDIPLISETMLGNETSEYSGTVTFFPFSELPDATLNTWETIMREQSAGTARSVEETNARIMVHAFRKEQFQYVVQLVIHRAFKVQFESSRW